MAAAVGPAAEDAPANSASAESKRSASAQAERSASARTAACRSISARGAGAAWPPPAAEASTPRDRQ